MVNIVPNISERIQQRVARKMMLRGNKRTDYIRLMLYNMYVVKSESQILFLL